MDFNTSVCDFLNETNLCLSFQNQHTMSDKLMSNTTFSIITTSTFALNVLVGAVGIPGNILTLLVYTRGEFDEHIHTSYISLAISDLGVVVFTLIHGLITIPANFELLSERVGLNQSMLQMPRYLQLVSSRCTAMITAWVSLERSICIVFPTKFKAILTRRLTIIVNISLFMASFAPLVLILLIQAFRRDSPVGNSTDWSVVIKDFGKEKMAANIIYNTVYPVVSFVIILTCTIYIVNFLRRSHRFKVDRHGAQTHISSNQQTGMKTKQTISTKELRVMKIVLTIAVVFILSCLPGIVNTLVSTRLREYSAVGAQNYLFIGVSGSFMVLNQVNSSINIFLYIYMGSRFRQAFKQIVTLQYTNRGRNRRDT